MSGPKGSVTKRDQRRQTRREQYEAARRQRQIEMQRQLRRKRLQRNAFYAAGALVVVLLAVLIIHAATGGGGSAASGTMIQSTGAYTAPATGETRDSMPCYSLVSGSEPPVAAHYHAYLEMYVDGQQFNVPANTGIPAATTGTQCIYPLHVHPQENDIIHIETQSTNTTYTLGAFFDIWGQPLSATQVGSYKADTTHKLVFEYFDANGKLHPWSGNPLNLPLQAHETIVILYNSPNVTPTAYTNWNGL